MGPVRSLPSSSALPKSRCYARSVEPNRESPPYRSLEVRPSGDRGPGRPPVAPQLPSLMTSVTAESQDMGDTVVPWPVCVIRIVPFFARLLQDRCQVISMGGGAVAEQVLFSGAVGVSYGQVYLACDEAPELDENFAGQVNGLCGAAVPASLFLVTGINYGTVGMAVELYSDEPPLSEAGKRSSRCPSPIRVQRRRSSSGVAGEATRSGWSRATIAFDTVPAGWMRPATWNRTTTAS
jgi:hypothetical protein